MKDDLGYRSAVLSDDLKPTYVTVSDDGERVFEISGTVEVSEFGLTSSRKKQERLRTGAQRTEAPKTEAPKTEAQKKLPSGESSVPKAR